MTAPTIDYLAVYRQSPLPGILLTPEFVIADVDQAYLDVTGRSREQLLGRDVFEAFPDNPADPHPTAVRESRASLARVLKTGKPDIRSFQKYDVEVPGSPGVYATRYWNIFNAPVFAADGQVALIAHNIEEITERVNKLLAGLAEKAARGRPE